MAGQGKGGSGTRGSGARGSGVGGSGARGSAGQRPRSVAAAERRQSPAVYRRRRLAVLILMALILGVLGIGVWAAVEAARSVAQTPAGATGQGDPAAAHDAEAASSATAAPPSSAGAVPSPTATASATPTCDPHLITVSAATDKPTYGANEKPVFTLKVTNGNPMPCEVNVGTKQMEFLVVSGTDRIFSSKDCQADAQDLPKTIPAGGSETANFPWERVRSTEGCKAVAVQPKPGIYVMTASIGATTSSKAVFELK